MKLQAKSDWVLIEPLGASEKDSPIYRFGAESANRNVGTVLSVGSGIVVRGRRVNIDGIVPGKLAYYDFDRATKIVYDGKEIMAIRARHVWAISE